MRKPTEEYELVPDSIEAALGAGILASILEGDRWVRRVDADPDQVGAEAEMFVHISADPDVILRLHVTEVRRKHA